MKTAVLAVDSTVLCETIAALDVAQFEIVAVRRDDIYGSMLVTIKGDKLPDECERGTRKVMAIFAKFVGPHGGSSTRLDSIVLVDGESIHDTREKFGRLLLEDAVAFFRSGRAL